MEAVTFPMNGYILTTKKTMYAIHVKDRTKILCFKDKKIANVCRLNAAKYKHRFGNWPDRTIDNSNSVFEKEDLLPKEKRMKLSDIYHGELIIDEVQTNDMQNYCMFNNMSLLLCNKYVAQNNKIHIEGIELNNNEIDFDAQINRFNYIYRNSRII